MHFCDLVRNILWTERLHDTANAQKDTMYFSDAQWYIAHRTGFGFAAKGGHNDEPHNHNDLGHFILATAHGQVLCDLGAGVYNKAYFIPDTRYDVIHTNSLGHSVPIIEGHQQVAGREHCAVVFEHGQDTFSLELAKAYDLPGLQSFQRSFHIAANGFALLDTFGFSGDVLSIIERFVTPIMPIEQKNGIRIGNAVLTWEIPATFVIKNVEIITHAHQPSVCYLIDILLP